MRYMVIERFRNRDPEPVYRRARERGRMLPDGLHYVGSWVETTFDRCFQVMECADERLLHAWVAHWSDLVDFELVPVISSSEAAATFADGSASRMTPAGATIRQDMEALVGAWCDRRALRALRAVLTGWPMTGGLTDDWAHLTGAVEQVRAFARHELSEHELRTVDDLIHQIARRV